MSKITLQEYMEKPNIKSAMEAGKIVVHCECDEEGCQGWGVLRKEDAEMLGLKKAVL